MNFECDYVTSVLNMLCCLWTMICVQYFVTESNKYTYTISTVFPFYKAFLKCPIPPGRHQEILSDCGFRRYERMFWSGNSVPFWSENSVLFWQKLWHFRKMGKFEVPNDSPEEDELHELFQISIHQKILWRRIQWRFQCTLRALWPHDFLAKSRAAMYVESIHFPGRFEYECGDCGKRLSTKQALMGHRTYHNQAGVYIIPKNWVFYKSLFGALSFL